MKNFYQNLSCGLKIVIVILNPNIMKSRILKTLIAVLAPLVIEFVIKKISEKLEKKDDKKQIPAQPQM
jgi:hypothetical protein